MKKSILALIAAGVILLCSCDPGNKNKSVDESFENSREEAYEEIPDIHEFIDGSKSVVNAKTGEKVTLVAFSENHTEPWRYSVVDLDGDGDGEYLVEYAESGDTVIINGYNDEYYAYMLPFRARQDLKAAGEMMWTSGASHSGTWTIEFSGTEMKQIKLLDSDFEEDIHYICGETVSHDEAVKAWDEFDKKTNADWFNVTPAFEY